MLKKLTYNAEFVATGRVLSQSLEFDTGLIAITGANEAGKSFVLEMIRFAWFGVGALRGQASDFAQLSVSLQWEMKGAHYLVERGLKNAKLSCGGEPLAVGTSAVNSCLLDLIGFGLAVFDVSCVANQGDIEKLSNMRPTERKRLVDSVIGIGALEVLAKWAGDEALLREKEAAGTRAGIRPVIEPDEPEGYEPSTDLADKLNQAEVDERQIQTLKAQLAVRRKSPEKPTETVNLPASALEPLARSQLETVGEIGKIEAHLRAMGHPVSTSEEHLAVLENQLQELETYRKAQMFLRLHPRPEMEIADIQAVLREIEAYEKTTATSTRISSLIRSKEGELCTVQAGRVECPACSHAFTPGAKTTEGDLRGEIEDLRAQLPVVPPAPAKTKAQLDRLTAAWASWPKDQVEAAEAVKEPVDPGINAGFIADHRRQNKLVEEKAQLSTRLAELKAGREGKPDFVTMLEQRKAYEQALVQWRQADSDYQTWVGERAQWSYRLSVLESKALPVSELRSRLTTAQVYEHMFKTYEEGRQLAEMLETRATLLEHDAAQYRRVRKSFIDLRQSVKQHLLPSLNAVASQLLRQMTGGSRQVVMIDDDFEIWVDKQKIHTLSGSGKACANLAIRIALGQVLTSRVFPLFLGDEIDASMDEFRAEQTALTLRSITDRISQLLLVSHKTVDADQTIRLET